VATLQEVEATLERAMDTRKCNGKQCLTCATPESIKCKNCLATEACATGCFGCQWTRKIGRGGV